MWIYKSAYQWEKYPVLRIDFSQLKVRTAAELESGLGRYLRRLARQHQLELETGAYYEQFADLIQQLAEKGKVVVLIDEYDKPLVDNLQNVAEARRIREVLRGFYTVLKGMDEYLRFVLLTGVSKFSKVGVFSGLNNLKDITLDNRFATMLGVTQDEINKYLLEHVRAFAENEGWTELELLAQMKIWYDGFSFSKKCARVYNPFSLLLLLDMQDFRNYWFESGTPTFLIKLIREQEYDIQLMEDLVVDELAFSSYEIGHLNVIPLLFQTGYLTIQSYDPAARLYKLYYPNYEVENAFSRYLLNSFVTGEPGLAGGYLWRLAEALRARDWEKFFAVLRIFLADIPYDIQLPREKYYQTIFYLLFKLIGLQIGAEVRTNRGRIDAVVETADGIFIFEFKLDASPAVALAQIRARGYAEQYSLRDAIYLIGVEFGVLERNVVAWQVEQLYAETPDGDPASATML